MSLLPLMRAPRLLAPFPNALPALRLCSRFRRRHRPWRAPAPLRKRGWRPQERGRPVASCSPPPKQPPDGPGRRRRSPSVLVPGFREARVLSGPPGRRLSRGPACCWPPAWPCRVAMPRPAAASPGAPLSGDAVLHTLLSCGCAISGRSHRCAERVRRQ
ncbi:MAG: hypothetical protein J3K34DRAFT_154987 [Monoraphidium minutum]|nr:MAG: hypothetical protein J3K34DRAFT_154987 [Monoraphidium minutum]